MLVKNSKHYIKKALPVNISSQLTQPLTEEQQSFLTNLLLILQNPIIRYQLEAYGYRMLPTRETVMQSVMDVDRLRKSIEVLWDASKDPTKSDREKLKTLVDVVLDYLHVDMDDDTKRKFIDKVAPILSSIVLMNFGEETYDALFGREGSGALLAKAVTRVYYDYGITGDKARNIANEIIKKISENPNISKEFTIPQIGEFLNTGSKLGLISASTDPKIFTKQLENFLSLLSSVKAGLIKNNIQVNDSELVRKALEIYSAKYQGLPLNEAAKRIRMDLWLASVAPFGLYQVAANRLGIQFPVPPSEYTKSDEQLINNAINSPVGNMIGATIRLVKDGVDGPLMELYERVISGDFPRISIGEWLRLARMSRVRPEEAYLLLHQPESNRAAIISAGPLVFRALRSAQYRYDIRPIIDLLNNIYGSPLVARGFLDRIASRMGYKGIGAISPGQYMLFLHSPQINTEATKILKDIMAKTKLEEEQSSLLKMRSPLRRLTEKLLQKEPITITNILPTIGEVGLGIYPIEELSFEEPEYKSLWTFDKSSSYKNEILLGLSRYSAQLF